MEYIIRKIKTDELHILTELFHYHDVDGMIQENKANLEKNNIDIFLLFIGSRPAGELHVMYDNIDTDFAIKNKRAYLYAYRIHKDFQNKGWGKILMQAVLSILEKQGYCEFTIGVEDNNERARHMYINFGFTESISRKMETYQNSSYEYNLLIKRI